MRSILFTLFPKDMNFPERLIVLLALFGLVQTLLLVATGEFESAMADWPIPTNPYLSVGGHALIGICGYRMYGKRMDRLEEE